MRIYILVISILSIFAISTYGQQLFIQKYPIEVHQASFQNWRMVQDQQGALYFANTSGLLIFDGASWQLISLPNKAYLMSLDIAPNGRVYVGANGDFGYFEKSREGNLEYVSLLPLLEETRRQAVRNVSDVEVWGESVLFSDEDHGYIYQDGKIDFLDKERLWFYQLGDSVYTIRGEKSTLYVYRNNTFQKTTLDLNFKLSLITSYKGSLLLMDDKNQVWLVDPNATGKNKVSILSEELNARFKELRIKNMRPLSDGRFAVLTDCELIIVDLNGDILERITRSMLGGSNLLSGILYEDSRHNVWFTTDEFIGLIITSSPLTYFDKTNGFRGAVTSLGEHYGQRYVGTNTGLYIQKSLDEFESIPGTNGFIWGIYNIDDHLYIAHDNGIYEIVEQRATKLISHEYPQALCSLAKHRDCIVMGAYNSGIWLLKKINAAWRKHKIRGFDGDTRFIQEDKKGSLWISDDQKGIWKLRLNEAMDSVIDKKFYCTPKLPSNLNNSIFKLSDQNIIVATEDGIYSYNESKDTFEPDGRFYKALQGTLIYSLVEAKEGEIYFRGKDKVKDISGVLIKQVDGTYSSLLTPFNKITWIDSDSPIIATQEGAWFANNSRIIAYSIKHKTYYQEVLQPVIKKVVAGDSVIYVGVTNRNTATIPYSSNSMLFDFDVAHYEDSEKNEFQFKLEGFDKEWSEWTHEREARFINLPEGDYTFVIRARNIYRNESQIASISFHIDPPAYRTSLAYLGYVGLFVILLYWVTHLRTKRVNRQKGILEREVQKKTKELLAMNKVLNASNYTKDKLFSIISHDLRGPIHQFQEIFKMIELGYISADEFRSTLVTDLKERANYVATLTDNLLHWAKGQMGGIQVNESEFRLTDVIQENISLLSSQAIKKSVTLKTEIEPSLPIAFADQDMVKLIIRNLVSNAIKFTPEMGSIVVGAKAERDYILVSVSDNGTGLSEEDINKILEKEYFTKYGTSGEKGSGLGLMLCREFIEKNGGEFRINSQPGIGSVFSFSLRIRK